MARVPGSQRRPALAVLGSAFAVTLFDGTIVYPALRQIRLDLHSAAATTQWIMVCYLIGFGGLLIISHRLADRAGPRRLFIGGAALLLVASTLSGVAWSIEALLVARLIQGAAAALIAPTMLVLLTATFAEGHGRHIALRVWTSIGALSGTMGLLLGGVLVSYAHWRWIFFTHAAVAALVLAFSSVLPRPEPSGSPLRRAELVVTGLGIGAAGLVVLAAGLGGVATVVLLGLSAILIAGFVFAERIAWPPLSPWRLLRSRAALGAVVVLVVCGLVFDGTLFLLSVHFQEIQRQPAILYALAMSILTLSSVGGSFVAQDLAVRYGTRIVAINATGAVAVGMLVCMVALGHTFVLEAIGLGLAGLGLGAAFTIAQMTVVTEAARSVAIPELGLTDASFSIGGGFGLALLPSIAIAIGLGAADHTTPATTVAYLTDSLRPAFGAAAAFAILGLIAALTLIPRRNTASTMGFTYPCVVDLPGQPGG